MKIMMLFCFGFAASLVVRAQENAVVFVCEHGSAKSVIAAAYFNKLAKEKGISWRAVSRGTHPDLQISPKTKKLLTEDKLFDDAFVPQKLSQADVDTVQQVILFCTLPSSIQGKGKTADWVDVNAVDENFQKLRDDIIARIKPLVDSLAKQ